MHREQLFLYILIFFAATTAITGILNEAAAGTLTLANVGSLASPGSTINGQMYPSIGASNSGNANLIYIEDFTNSSGYNTSVLNYGVLGGSIFNPWTQVDGVGYTLTGNLPLTSSHFWIQGVQPNSAGLYDVVYNVQDSVNANFDVDVNNFGTGDLQVQVTTTGLYVQFVNGVYTGNAYQLLSGSYYYPSTVTSIETIYSPSANTLTVNVNGGSSTTFTVNLANAVNFPAQPSSLSSSTGFAGITANANGFVVTNIIAPILLTTASANFHTGIPFIDAILAAGASIASAISQFGALMGTILGVGQNALVPFWLWAIFGIPCIATLILIGIEIARGD
jgi:hypothetical protein